MNWGRTVGQWLKARSWLLWTASLGKMVSGCGQQNAQRYPRPHPWNLWLCHLTRQKGLCRCDWGSWGGADPGLSMWAQSSHEGPSKRVTEGSESESKLWWWMSGEREVTLLASKMEEGATSHDTKAASRNRKSRDETLPRSLQTDVILSVPWF